MAQETLSTSETERKFVLSRAPEGLENFPVAHILQGYLVITPDHEMRLRKKTSQKGISYSFAYKGGHGITRRELDLGTTEESFNKYWGETEGRRVEKHRYTVSLPERTETFEVDVFLSVPGLILLEVEFTSADEAASFVLPREFYGAREVTGQPQYENQSLSQYGLSDV